MSRFLNRVAGLVVLAAPLPALVQDPAPLQIPHAPLERVFDGGTFLEGPAMGYDGKVYFSDLTDPRKAEREAGHLWQYDPETGVTEVFRSPSGMSNGLFVDARFKIRNQEQNHDGHEQQQVNDPA